MKPCTEKVYGIGRGVVKIYEFPNGHGVHRPDVKLPLVTIMLPNCRGDSCIDRHPAVSLQLIGPEVRLLYEALHQYYTDSNIPQEVAP